MHMAIKGKQPSAQEVTLFDLKYTDRGIVLLVNGFEVMEFLDDPVAGLIFSRKVLPPQLKKIMPTVKLQGGGEAWSSSSEWALFEAGLDPDLVYPDNFRQVTEDEFYGS